MTRRMGNSTSSGKKMNNEFGYRVLGVQPSSPASNVGLVSFFDFIISANGEYLGHKNVGYFVDLIKRFDGCELSVEVYNCKNHTVRKVNLVPSKNWTGGEGRLGVAIRYDRYIDAEFSLCRVLHVEIDSPADLAGLVPNSDYILGTQEMAFTDSDMLEKELEKKLGKTCKLYIYNSVRDEVRVAIVMPSKDWGVKGANPGDASILGAEVGCGFLHRLPEHSCETLGFSTDKGLRPSHES